MNPQVRSLFIDWSIGLIALWVVDGLLDSVTMAGAQPLLLASLLFLLINQLVRPLLMTLALPLVILSLGLLVPVLNGLVLLMTAALVPGFEVQGFWSGVWAALLISVISSLLRLLSGQRVVAARIQTPGQGGFEQPRADAPDDRTIDVEVKEKR